MLDVIIAESIKPDVLPIQCLNVCCNDKDIFTVYLNKCGGIPLMPTSDVYDFADYINVLAAIAPETTDRIVIDGNEKITGRLFGNITKNFTSETGLTLDEVKFESDISNLKIEVLPKKEVTFYFDATHFETNRIALFDAFLIKYRIAKTIREIISDNEISYNCYISGVGDFVLSIRKRKVGKFHLCYNRKMPALLSRHVDRLSELFPDAR